MDIQFGPNALDVPNLLYKLQHKIKVFNTGDTFNNRGYNLITSSSKYGIVFIASPDCTLTVYYLKQLIDKDGDAKHLEVKLQERPSHIAVGCDHELLAITGGQLLAIYKVTDFQNRNVAPTYSIRCDVNPSTSVSALQWNPCIPDSIAIAYFDGTLLACQVTHGQLKKIPSKARCICWSPKGKQLVTGNSDGSLTQYKPDLTPAKTVPAPNLFENSPVEALAIYWTSTFQFVVVFKNASDNSRPSVAVVNTPKGGQPSCLNYEDICYSMGSNRPWYYYLCGLPQWNIILASSSNSMEIATLGSTDGASWVQWCQSDEARPELPLTDKKLENYPIGVCIDTSASHQLPWGENETLPHMPLLLVLSHSGLLTIFNVINLNKEAPQICSPSQTLTLPADVMTGEIPGALPAPAPAQPVAPPPQPQPQPQPQQQPQLQPARQTVITQPFQPVQPTQVSQQSSGMFSSFTVKLPEAKTQVAAPVPQVAEQKQAAPQTVPQIQTAKIQTPKPVPEAKPFQSPEVNTALKEEQEKMTKLKADQELKGMLIKEVNDFQKEVYKFNVKIREAQNKLYKDINSLSSDFDLQSLDVDQLRRLCGLEELRAAVVQLKMDLVRSCAAVAETRTHTEMKDFHEWTHADPLTTKRVSNIKKMAYYVQNQLEQAQKALDHKWTDMISKNAAYNKPGQRMIRPILEDIYQPLVKQQEILCRQQAVLRTLRNTLNECNSSPLVKTTSILRSTPFKNKDNLSKLTKNILNMSIEPQKPKSEEYLSAQKLDALRDLLANNRPAKIKPITVEITQHLKAVRLSYEKSLKEKAAEVVVDKKKEPIKEKVVEPTPLPQVQQPNTQIKPDLVIPQQQQKQPSVKPPMPQVPPQPVQPSLPSFASANNVKSTAPLGTNQSLQPGLANVARTLFSDPPIQEQPKSVPAQPQQPKPQVPLDKKQPTPKPVTSTPINTKSVLKELLQNKSALASLEAKSNESTFMGQKICSPSAFSFSTPNTTMTPTVPNVTAKPIADISNMFNKLQNQGFSSDPKINENKATSDETGEVETTGKVEEKKEENSVFSLKTSTPPPSSNQLVPDVLKSSTQTLNVKSETKATLEKSDSQENNADKSKVAPLKPSNKENVVKSESQEVKPSIFGSSILQTTSASKPVFGGSGSIFGAAPSNQATKPLFGLVTSTTSASSIFSSTSVTTATSVSSQAGSIFGNKSATTITDQTKVVDSNTETVTTADSTKPVSTNTEVKSVFATNEPTETKVEPKTDSGEKPEAVSTSSTFSFTTSTTESKPSIFSTPTPATTPSVFGNQPAFTTSAPSVFGSSASSVFASAGQQQSSIFGAPPATTSQSVFGSSTTTQSAFASTTKESVFASSSVFGTATTAQSAFGTTTATTQSSIFGAASTPTQSIFGSPTTQASVFGGQQTSVFGSPTTATTTQSSVFGAQTTQASSIFAKAVSNTAQSSIFGAPPVTTATGGSLFGAGESNLFAAASISTTEASSQPTGSIFGGSPGSAFSNAGTNVFGGKTTFGQSNPTAASIFGGGAAFGQKQESTNNFWGNSNNTNANSSGWFGKDQPTTQASSIFGNTTGGSFSTPAPGGAFGSPQQSSVFGSPQQQKAPAFGGSTAFGSKAVFGQSSGFGSPPAAGGFGSFGGFNKSPTSGFGAPAAFGGSAGFGAPAFGGSSPGKVFGGPAATGPSFGATQSNATFENLATQNTLTFGNLAQQSPTAQPAPAFNTSPSFTGWRG